MHDRSDGDGDGILAISGKGRLDGGEGKREGAHLEVDESDEMLDGQGRRQLEGELQVGEGT